MKNNLEKNFMGNKKFLSSDGFQKWLRFHDINENEINKSKKVFPKIKFSELIEKIEIHEGDLFETAKCFRKNGGIINEITNNIITVKTKKGIFSIEENNIKYKIY